MPGGSFGEAAGLLERQREQGCGLHREHGTRQGQRAWESLEGAPMRNSHLLGL